MNEELLQYPIGKFTPQESYTKKEMEHFLDRIETLPARVASVIQKFSSNHLETTYRDGGWSARQVVHHVADSHMNAYIRIKWALTEATPVIKAYNEKLWAETAEVKLDPAISLHLLKALHMKWVALLKLLSEEDLQKAYIHPETKKQVRLDKLIAMYAWHGDHHLGHLEIIARKLI